MTTIDAELEVLRSDIATPAVKAALQRLAEYTAFNARAQVGLEAARRELTEATSAHDSQRASAAASRVHEAELVLEAAAAVEFDRDGVVAVLQSVKKVLDRFNPEIGLPYRRTYIEDRARLSRPWATFADRHRQWSHSGTPAHAGVQLLIEASEWATRIDDYVAAHPIPPRQEDALVRDTTSRPARHFINL
jgi:hypothetical protein